METNPNPETDRPRDFDRVREFFRIWGKATDPKKAGATVREAKAKLSAVSFRNLREEMSQFSAHILGTILERGCSEKWEPTETLELAGIRLDPMQQELLRMWLAKLNATAHALGVSLSSWYAEVVGSGKKAGTGAISKGILQAPSRLPSNTFAKLLGGPANTAASPTPRVARAGAPSSGARGNLLSIRSASAREST